MRAYIVTARTDMDNLQLLLYQLRPDTMHRVPSMEPAGQTRYIPRVLVDDPVTLVPQTDTSAQLGARARGLAAWALDNIQNQAGGKSLALTAAQAAEFSQKIRLRVDAGLPLGAADLDAALNTVAGVSNSSVVGAAGSLSTGSVADLLGLLGGSIYQVEGGATLAAPGATFPADLSGKHVPAGAFLPDLPMNPPSFVGTWQFPEKTLQPGHPPAPRFPTRNGVPLVDTGELRMSVRQGEMSKLVDPRYHFRNPRHSYGAGGTATTLGGQPVPGVDDPNPYQARALVVYDDAGAVIV